MKQVRDSTDLHANTGPLREAAKQSSYTIGQAIKREGGKGHAIKEKDHSFTFGLFISGGPFFCGFPEIRPNLCRIRIHNLKLVENGS